MQSLTNIFHANIRASHCYNTTNSATFKQTTPLLYTNSSKVRTRRSQHPHAPRTSTVAMASSISRSAWRISKVGNIQNLQLIKEDIPAPVAGEVLVNVKAVGLNFADVFTCLGLYNASPRADFVPGLEFSGVVEAVGKEKYQGESPFSSPAVEAAALEDAKAFNPGDRVCGVLRFGSYASRVNCPACQLRPLPDSWSFAEGAAYLVQALTAVYGLKSLGDIRTGQHVLVQSAAGGVGLLAVAICLAVRAHPTCIVGQQDKVNVLKERFPTLTAAAIVVRKSASEFEAQLRESLSAQGAEGGFDIVLDAVSGEYFNPSYAVLQQGGRYVVYGAANFTPSGNKVNWWTLAWKWLRRPVIDPLALPGENKSVMGFNLIWMFDKVSLLQGLGDELQVLKLAAPLVGEKFPFDDAQGAIRALQSGKTVGKVVLEL